MHAGNVAVTVLAPKRLLLRVIAIALLFVVSSWAVLLIQTEKSHKIDGVKLQLADQRFALEIADTESERQTGLSNRNRLAGDAGMLFLFEEAGRYCFWMKETRFPLDIIWLKDKKVIHVKYNATPESYPESFCPSVEATEVIELNAGVTAPKNIMIGSTLLY